MKLLQANNKKNAFAKVDDDVFETIQQMGLKFSIDKYGYWLSTTLIKLSAMTEKKHLLLHRFVYIFKTGEESELTVDHEDRDKSNNQFSNLRSATAKEQKYNQGKYKNNTSGFSGVDHYHKVSKYKNKKYEYDFWRARIQRPNGKREEKRFDYDDKGLLEAVRWRDQKVREYYKEFAVPNLTDETP